jgi:two-component system, chemotaxis family, sensor kinase CheA
MDENRNRRSLKKRITNMVSLVNFSSLLVMLVALMLALGVAFNLLSNIISENAALQMATQLSSEWNKAINENKITVRYDSSSSIYKNIFSSLGGDFKIFHDNHKPLNINSLPKNIKEMPMPHGLSMVVPNLPTIEYKILTDKDVVIFNSSDTRDMKQSLVKIPQNNYIMTFLNPETEINIKSDSGVVLGKLIVKFNQNIILAGYIIVLSICIFIFLLTLFFSKIAIRILSHAVVKPLVLLDEKINQLGDGNIECAATKEITFKKPVREVENLINSTNKIMFKMNEYIKTLGSQKIELEAQNIDLLESSNSLENINLVLANKNSKLKNILDNVEQGFLTFKKDLFIQNEYSLICEKIFNGNLSSRTLSSVLFPANLNSQKFVDELLIKIFNSNKSERKIFTPLLPEEVIIGESVINITYKVVKDEKDEDSIMVIISDITEKRQLEKLMDEERKTLKMVVKSIINRVEFLELIKEFEEFARQDFKHTGQMDYDRILRQIHTFKGNFSQYDMVNLVPKLNELEDKIYDKNNDYEIYDIENLQLNQWLKSDLSIIESYAGKDFIKEGEYCHIKKEKLIEIEKKIQQTLSQHECRIILPLIKSLRYKTIEELLKSYPDYVMKLSERLEKSIKPLEIHGDEILVDTNYYQNVIKSLAHIFRNCVDHGIETEDERLELGKEQAGNITCEIIDLKDSFQIRISDDGRGINLSALEEKVIEEKLYNSEELFGMSLKQKYDCIFEQGITTKKEPTYISGRGVGMAAVKSSIVDIGGHIEVDSEEGKGTVFTLTLPKHSDNQNDAVGAKEFMKEVVETSRTIILKQTGLAFIADEIKNINNITLNNITSLLSLTGTLNSIILISVNEAMSRKLVTSFILDDIEEHEMNNYIEDVLGELSNTILGNAFGSFENTKSLFHIGLPAVLSNSEAYIKYTQSQIISCKLLCGEYEISLNMLMVDDEANVNDIEEVI